MLRAALGLPQQSRSTVVSLVVPQSPALNLPSSPSHDSVSFPIFFEETPFLVIERNWFLLLATQNSVAKTICFHLPEGISQPASLRFLFFTLFSLLACTCYTKREEKSFEFLSGFLIVTILFEKAKALVSLTNKLKGRGSDTGEVSLLEKPHVHHDTRAEAVRACRGLSR